MAVQDHDSAAAEHTNDGADDGMAARARLCPSVQRLRGLCRLALIAAALAGVAAWLVPSLWTEDPSSDSRLRAFAGFGVLLLEVFAFHGGLALLTVAAFAVIIRFFRFAAVLALLGLAHAGPGLAAWAMPGQDRPVASVEAGPTLTVLASNLLFTTADLDALSAMVDRERPDVIMLQEVLADRADEIRRRFAGSHPHAIGPDSRRWGAMLLSREPFVSTEIVPGHAGWSVGQPVGRLRLASEHGPVEVAVGSVHLPSPLNTRQLIAGVQMADALGDWAAGTMRVKDAPDAMILAGDFNAPLWTTRMRPLREAGLVEAHAQAGRGRGSTWPEKFPLSLAPGIRLDQSAAVGALRCVESRVLEPIGSDHRPILARYVLGRPD